MSLHLGVWVGHGQRSPDRSQTAKARLRPVTRDCSATLQNSCLSDFEHKCWKKAIGPPSTYPPTPNSEPWTLGSPWQSDMHGAMFVVYLWFHANHKPATHLTSTWIAFIFLYCLVQLFEDWTPFIFPWVGIVWNGDVSSPSPPPADEWVTVAI